MEYTIIVAVREHDGSRQFLMVDHKHRGWELPGGKLEGKEGPVHCALREFREETGHLLAEPKYVFKLRKENGICHVFTGVLGPRAGAVADGEVVQGLQWFNHLPENLAFPDDPYEAMGDALGLRFRPDESAN